MFTQLTNDTKFHFTNCEGCYKCCEGLAPLIKEDFDEVYERFPIVFARISDTWRALMIFSQPGVPCRYLENEWCSIYESRPPACKLYPISPYNNTLQVDNDCPAVGEEGQFLAEGNKIAMEFYHERLDNFPQKYQNTLEGIKGIEQELELVGNVGGLDMYKYTGIKKEPWLIQHLQSLKHLSEAFKG